jgi:hypothetical protein
LGPTATLDAVKKEVNLAPSGNRTPAVEPVAYRCHDSFCLMGLKKIMTTISQDSWSTNQYLKPGPPDENVRSIRLKIHVMNYGKDKHRRCNDA